jgi:hypothetical protein
VTWQRLNETTDLSSRLSTLLNRSSRFPFVLVPYVSTRFRSMMNEENLRHEMEQLHDKIRMLILDHRHNAREMSTDETNMSTGSIDISEYLESW